MKRSKRVLAILLSAAMMLALVSCGSSSSSSGAASSGVASSGAASSSVEADPYALTEPVDLLFACQGSGTGDYVNATTFAAVMEKALPSGSKVGIETSSTGCSGAGYLIEAGNCDLIFAQNGISATVGTNGRAPFTGAKALVACVKDNINVQVLNKKFVDKTGYDSIEDALEAQYPIKIYSEPAGSADEALLSTILGIYGLTVADIESWGGSVTYCSGSECVEGIKDGTCDLFMTCTSTASANLTELGMTTDCVMSTFSDDLLAKLVDAGYCYIDIAAGSFQRFPEGAKNVCLGGSVIVPESMDDAVAYNLTKAIVEGLDEIAVQIPAWAEWTPKDGTDTTVSVIDLHPGAIAYFEEIGAM